jgi:ribulose-5-phosphate 4-epimerase/fuculose-1-phosphate aldolase
MGLGTSVWGHASVRSPLNPSQMLLAPFGESFSHATASTLVPTPLHPEALTEGQRLCTNITAVVLHGAVYSQRPDAACVLHTHSPYCTAMAASDLTFNAESLQDAMQFVGRVAYHDFGGVADESEEMELVAAAARNADALFLRNHGVLVVGEDIETAFSRLFYLERCCQTQLLVHVRLRRLCFCHALKGVRQPFFVQA